MMMVMMMMVMVMMMMMMISRKTEHVKTAHFANILS